jgi:pyrimidine-nucleoside phosphorylase
MEVTHQLAGAMIYLGGKAASIELGIEQSKHIISEGKAWEKFLAIVKSQNGNTDFLINPNKYPKSKFQLDYSSRQTGWIKSIDAFVVGTLSVRLGAGRLKADDKIDFKSGIRFRVKVGNKIDKGSCLFKIYTDKEEVMEEAAKQLSEVVKISPIPVQSPKMILDYIDKSRL